MKKFIINYTEVSHGFATVEAANNDEAEEMYLDVYNEGNVVWTNHSITDFTVKEDTQ